jgi:hypothetical protein
MTIFRAYVNKPVVALYPDEFDRSVTPPIVATVKVPLEDKHVGAVFRVGEVRHRIVNVSHVYEPRMLGENDSHGDYRIISTEVTE